jgi:hypothetical protein
MIVMKLRDACEIAYACGLKSIDEAVLFIEMHTTSLFSYYDAAAELAELNMDYKLFRNQGILILDLFPELEALDDV